MGQSIGFHIQHVSLADTARMLPCMKTDDLVDACYCPTDGHLRPAELVRAFMEVGQSHGVEYRSDTPVEQIVLAGGTVRGVKVGGGQIHAPCVVNAAGPWSYGVAGLAGAKLPAAALGHRYLTTRPDPLHLIDPLSPGVRDRHHRIYARPEGGGLIVGMYEAEPVAYDTESLPADFDMSAMQPPPDDAHVAQLIRAAGARFPWITTETPMTITAGIMTFTPDGNPLCGQMPNVSGLFHCSGFSGHGMIQSPAIGLIMSQLILDGETTYDLEAIEADRFFDMPGFQHRDEIKAKCLAMYASYYGGVEGQAQLGGWKSEVGRE
jgi:4-methylaminobutanoate oxidase (formaldehyde-forming)